MFSFLRSTSKSLIGSGFALSSVSGLAMDCVEKKFRISTPLGDLRLHRCRGTEETVEKWVLGQTQVVAGQAPIADVAQSPNGKYVVFSGGAYDHKAGCAGFLRLADFSSSPPKVITLGVRNACNEFHWAKWGGNRSVIALKNNVKFTYSNGKFTPPAMDNELISSIKPSMFDTPVSLLQPFVVEDSIR